MDFSKIFSAFSLSSTGSGGGLLGFIGRIMEAGHESTEPTPAPTDMDTLSPELEADTIDPNAWAEESNRSLREMQYMEALAGKGSFFIPITTGTGNAGLKTDLNTAQAASLSERIVFDYSNMLKLSESGRVSVRDGQLRTRCVSNFYFDSTGNLTVGYGTNLDANPHLLDQLEVINNQTGKPLTLEQKRVYFRRLKDQYARMGSPRGMTDGQYAKQAVFNECRITEASATAVMNQEVQMHLDELLADFRKNGHIDPATIDHNILKLALDIKYNVGGRLSKKYPTLFKKICSGDYASITPEDYRVCTSKTNKNACNIAREKMKTALVKQAQMVQSAMQQHPLPANASAEVIAAYKQQIFRTILGPTIELYQNMPNGQLLLPDAARSMALSIETALHGPLNTQQMAMTVQTTDNMLTGIGIPVNDGQSGGTTSTNSRLA